jgi:hypothetical protein
MIARSRATAHPIPISAIARAGIARKCDACAEEEIARKPVPGPAAYSFAQVSLLPSAAAGKTLEVSEPQDAGEREADAVADEVMHRLSSSAPPDDAVRATSLPPGLRLQRETDAAAPTAPAAPSGGLLAGDEAKDLLPGQMRKSEFLAALRPAVCDAANQELAAVGRDTQGCPYLDKMFAHYASQDAQHVERAIRKYAPEAAGAQAAADYIAPLGERVAQGVRRWASTGNMPELPEGLSPEMFTGGGGALGVLSSALGAVGGAIKSLFFKAESEAARAGVDRSSLEARLDTGRPLGAETQSRMGAAFGHDFSHVRVHADGAAAAAAQSLDARAFTMGTHIAFAAGQYHPGDPAGDALLAHELVHVIQQHGAVAAAQDSERAVEEDADRGAEDAVMSLHGSERTPRPRLRSGLRLARCGPSPQDKLQAFQRGELADSDVDDDMARDAADLFAAKKLELSPDQRTALIKALLEGDSASDQRAIIKILENSTDVDILQIFSASKDLRLTALEPKFKGAERESLRAVLDRLRGRFPTSAAIGETKGLLIERADVKAILTSAFNRTHAPGPKGETVTRECCGILMERPDGTMVSKDYCGEDTACPAPALSVQTVQTAPASDRILGSYHTHPTLDWSKNPREAPSREDFTTFVEKAPFEGWEHYVVGPFNIYLILWDGTFRIIGNTPAILDVPATTPTAGARSTLEIR